MVEKKKCVLKYPEKSKDLWLPTETEMSTTPPKPSGLDGACGKP